MHDRTIVDEFTRQAESFNTAAVANAPETLAELARFAAPSRDERWLEAACGPGLIARALAPLAGAVVGVDATPAMVSLARREAAGLANVEFALGDAGALAFADGEFDGAITRFSLHHIPVPSRVVAELARVVRPGGKVVIADHLVDDDADAAAWETEVERLRDPSHWAALPLRRLRALGEAAGLTLEAERIVPLALDYEDWLARGGGPRGLVEAALAERPAGAECLRVADGVLELRMWIGRWSVKPIAGAGERLAG
jgi:SAM-dependent methyltransferase